MGNYVFSIEALIDTVTEDADDETSQHDVGGNIIPLLVERGTAQVFDFAAIEVPGATDRDRGYWRDVGRLDAYYEAHMDLISVDPVFNLYNWQWPIHTWPDPLPPAKFVFEEDDRTGHALDSRVCAGVVVSGATVRRSVLPRRAPALPRRGRGLDPHALGRRWPACGGTWGDRRQERAHRRRRADRRRPGGRPRAVLGLAGRRSGHRQGRDGGVPRVKVALLTREYPPHVYGGAGVRVEYLTRELARLDDLAVHCWEDEQPASADGGPQVVAHQPWDALAGRAPHLAALQAVSVDLTMAAGVQGANIVHSHTWYANLGGHLAKLIYDLPHVATVHSLEPLRPWKAEQLGGGYTLSSFCERTALEAADALIAVSEGMRADLLSAYSAIDPERVEVIYNGVDVDEYKPDSGTDVLERHGVDPDAPSVVFVGRITQQKGVAYLLEAALAFDPAAQLVLCAGSPDTPEIGAEVERRVQRVREERGNVIWLDQMLPRREVIQLLSHATVFVCPSIYEPLGIVISRPWPARPRSWRPQPAASSRSSRTAPPACACRLSRARTGPARRVTRRGSPRPSPSGSTTSWPTRRAPPRWAAPAAAA
jgi:alpha-maltose-1-phosphate synthase